MPFVTANYYYEPMNFEKNSGKLITFNANYQNSTINVIIPNDFNIVVGNNTGNNSVYFVMVYNGTTNLDKKVFSGEIFVNNTKIDDYYLIMTPDEQVVDNKIELGHGDFNYLDNNSVVGKENYLLFSLIRVWGVGSELLNEDMRNINFTCEYPNILPSTIDSKYKIINTNNNLVVNGFLSRARHTSIFRLFALSQNFDFSNQNYYFVNCSDLTYEFTHTKIIAKIPSINLTSVSLNPFAINVSSGDDELLLFLLNNESYNVRNVEIKLRVNDKDFIERINEVKSGEVIKLVYPANDESIVLTSISFVPQWYFNSRNKRLYYQQNISYFSTTNYFYNLNISNLLNASLITTNIFETQLITSQVNISQQPLYSNLIKLDYDFYYQGALIKTEGKIIRDVGSHNVSMNSDGLHPASLFEDYDVVISAYVQDENNEWVFIGSIPIGKLRVNQLTSNAPRREIYDVIVNNDYNRYDMNDDEVTANILIKNVGDEPDHDTILTYYLLGSDGQKYSETREQFYEVPVGVTLLSRSLPLPPNPQRGTWEFHAEYETAVQPTISVYDSFQMVEKIPLVDKINDRIIKKYTKNKAFLYGFPIILLILIFLLLLVILINGKEKRKEEFAVKY